MKKHYLKVCDMAIKLIACDLDDTLLSHELKITEENLEAIKKIKEAGVEFILCSGRPKWAMERFISIVDEVIPSNYGVAYNGSTVYNPEHEIMFSNILEEDVVSRLIDISRDWDICLQLYEDEEFYVEKYDKYTKEYQKISDMKLVIKENLKDIKWTYKALFNYKSSEKLEDLRKLLLKEFPDLNIFYSKPEFLEVLSKGSNKGSAVKIVADILGVEREEVLCIGDGLNDLSMIEYAGIGIAMKNGNEELKKAADYISTRTNEESVIVEVYEKFIK